MKIQRIACTDCPNDCFVKQCSEDWLTKLESKKYWLNYPAHQYFIREGGPVQGVYFIQKGKVKVTSTGIHRKEQVVRFASEGDIVGHRGFGAEKFPINAYTMENSLLCMIENETLNTLLLNNPRLTYALMQYYASELRKTEVRLKYMAQMNIRERVAEALLFIDSAFGTNPDGLLNLNLTRNDLAEIAGTNNEQVSRQLSELENEGLILRVKRKIKLLDKPGIMNIIKGFSITEDFYHKIKFNTRNIDSPL